MKTALLYVLLVGLPVLGLFGVLQFGGLVEAPPAVGGWWAYTSASPASAGCLPATGVFEIVQSGKYAVVSAPDRPGAQARMRRGVLRTEPSGEAGCDGPLSVEARAGQDVSERLEGTMGVPGCPSCAGASFVAVRTEAPQATVAVAPAPAH